MNNIPFAGVANLFNRLLDEASARRAARGERCRAIEEAIYGVQLSFSFEPVPPRRESIRQTRLAQHAIRATDNLESHP